MNVTIVAGARPNFIKIGPIIKELKKSNMSFKMVHTGQHYDDNMSKVFFENLDIPTPDATINSQNPQVMHRFAIIVAEFENFLIKEKPDLVMVVGDVDSTFACAFTARRLGIKVAHVEAGLRSRNEKMPEETNRILTDHVSDILFITEDAARQNLMHEGIDTSKIHLVGNVMIDSLFQNKDKIKKSAILMKINVKQPYIIATLHRPENVDSKENLKKVVSILNEIKGPVILPLHPRTKAKLEQFNLKLGKNIQAIDPVGYIDFLNLLINAKAVLTDSGGITEEASILNIPCLTLRTETERPITVHKGTNTLVNTSENIIKEQLEAISNNTYKQTQEIPLWEGKAAERIVSILKNF